METVIQFSQYLRSRRFNRTTVNQIGKAITPCIVEFNNDNVDHPIKVSWCMSAKYQTGTIIVEMEANTDLTESARDFINVTLSDELENWFGVSVDEDDFRDNYSCTIVGF